MDRLTGLIELITVVETQSFSEAARKLGVSVSLISRHVAALESRLGAKLLIRTTRSVQPTAIGKHLAEESKPLLDELIQTQERVLAVSESAAGLIRLSMGGHFAEREVVPVLARFCKLHPRVRLEVDVSNREVDLLDGQFDLALRARPVTDTNTLVARPFANTSMVTLGAPALVHQLEAELGTPLGPARVPSHHCLSLAGRPWRLRQGEQTHVIEPGGPFSSNSAEALLAAAAAGLGLIHVPAYYLSAATSIHGLIPLFTDCQTEDWATFHIVYVRNKFMPTRVRLLIDYLLSSHLCQVSNFLQIRTGK